MTSQLTLQEFPWIEAEQKDVTVENRRIIPVKNIETNFGSIKIYSEENPHAK